MTLVPDDLYDLEIIGAYDSRMANNKGDKRAISFSIFCGEYSGTEFSQIFSITHINPKSQDKGNRLLKELYASIGIILVDVPNELPDPSLLVGRRVVAKLVKTPPIKGANPFEHSEPVTFSPSFHDAFGRTVVFSELAKADLYSGDRMEFYDKKSHVKLVIQFSPTDGVAERQKKAAESRMLFEITTGRSTFDIGGF